MFCDVVLRVVDGDNKIGIGPGEGGLPTVVLGLCLEPVAEIGLGLLLRLEGFQITDFVVEIFFEDSTSPLSLDCVHSR